MFLSDITLPQYINGRHIQRLVANVFDSPTYPHNIIFGRNFLYAIGFWMDLEKWLHPMDGYNHRYEKHMNVQSSLQQQQWHSSVSNSDFVKHFLMQAGVRHWKSTKNPIIALRRKACFGVFPMDAWWYEINTGTERIFYAFTATLSARCAYSRWSSSDSWTFVASIGIM